MGTITMSAAEVGGYIRLLCFQWQNGPIPDDPVLLQRLTGCDGNAVASIRHKFGVKDGMLSNARLESVRTVQAEYRERQRENAQKRWVGIAKPHAVALPVDMPEACSPSSSSSSNSVSNSNLQKDTEGAKAPGRFSVPLPHEVSAYSLAIGYPLDGEAWCDTYAAKGWKVGKNGMKDWKAAVRNWKRHEWTPGSKAESVKADSRAKYLAESKAQGFDNPI